MKLIMIYGPPASGKLIVARALHEITDFKLLHDHLIVDICREIFNDNSLGRLDLNLAIRDLIVEIASKHGVKGIISTFTYYAGRDTTSVDHAYYRSLFLRMKSIGGEACFVRLNCDRQ